MIDRSIGRLTDWLTDWMIEGMVDTKIGDWKYVYIWKYGHMDRQNDR